ncbi:MAG: DUF6502 family protein [Betaproteobacteria bacterium]
MKSKLKSDEVLEICVASLLPLVRYCLLEGVNYPLFIKALKPVFAQAAQLELDKSGVKVNDSSVSLLSGLHRKDVRELDRGSSQAINHSGSVTSLVFTRWISDPIYVQKNGKPRRLVKSGPAPSFESLALSITQDVHPGSVLKSMEAQGMVRHEGEGKAERIALVRESFIPRDDLGEMLAMFAANLQDHISAAASNLRGGDQPLLEQAVFGNDLSKVSVDKLEEFSRARWAEFSRELIKLANQLCAQDKGVESSHRFRLGNYFYSTPVVADKARGGTVKAGGKS